MKQGCLTSNSSTIQHSHQNQQDRKISVFSLKMKELLPQFILNFFPIEYICCQLSSHLVLLLIRNE